MAENDVMESSTPETTAGPDLIRVVGALVYGAPEPLTVRALRKIIRDVAAKADDDAPETVLVNVTDGDIRNALDTLRTRLEQQAVGIHLVEIAEGFRFFTDPECSPWLRHVLQTEKPARLSRPALETLAIIAYRQPVPRSEIEDVRGVSVDHVVRNLMEFQLIRIVGRSELPGRPLLYGTTQRFLEHFGLKELRELPGIAELARRDRETTAAPAPDDAASTPTEPESGNTGDTPTPADASDSDTPVTDESATPANEHAADVPDQPHMQDSDETTAEDESPCEPPPPETP